MLRKGISALIALVLFASVAVNASASPLGGPVQNRYTTSQGTEAAVEPQAIPLFAAGFVAGVGLGIAAGYALFGGDSANQTPALPQSAAETAFNY
ncbi:MAG: hypothetical protein OHK0022_20250 [Roseiflexaceae bacterium]